MKYILIQQDDLQQLYQCILRGKLVYYKNAAGVITPQVGGSHVIDPHPATPVWDVADPPEDPEPLPDFSTAARQARIHSRFTNQELVSIRNAADVPTLEASDAAAVQAVLVGADISKAITLEHLQHLETLGLINAGRADIIAG